MKTKSLFSKFSSKGFTLIELLIVIAILGILAAAILVAINPVKQMNKAKDSTIRSDIAQIATAMQTYYTAKGTTGTASYPISVSALVTEGELKTEPKIDGITSYSVRCTAVTGGCSEVAVYGALKSTANVWCWRSFTGVAAELTDANCMP